MLLTEFSNYHEGRGTMLYFNVYKIEPVGSKHPALIVWTDNEEGASVSAIARQTSRKVTSESEHTGSDHIDEELDQSYENAILSRLKTDEDYRFIGNINKTQINIFLNGEERTLTYDKAEPWELERAF